MSEPDLEKNSSNPDTSPENGSPNDSPNDSSKVRAKRRRLPWPLRALLWFFGLILAGALSVAFVVGLAVAKTYPNLPDVTALMDYRPKLPLRVYAQGEELITEFGQERRRLTPIEEIPQVMIDAVLAIEDTRFFEHSGVDYKGMMRAALANFGREKAQGASTITMQVARNVFLSSEKTYTRKIYEVLLTFKLEHLLTKEKILEIYMNQIFLGHRAYGFAAASEVYFGKPIREVTIAEAAMLAGLPKAPSAYNPISNPRRARVRQQHIIDRMEENGFISAEQAEFARQEPLRLRRSDPLLAAKPAHAEYVAEMVRQLIYSHYGEETYTQGLNVYTTVELDKQEVAYRSLRKGIMAYEQRQHYRGPEAVIDLPSAPAVPAAPADIDDAIDEALQQYPDNGDVLSAVVLEASPKLLVVQRSDGQKIEIKDAGLKPVASGLRPQAAANIKIVRGAVIRIMNTSSAPEPEKAVWVATQLPEVEGAFVALEPASGAIRALVGGFDFEKNKFNHVTQAWRQPGSAFKPFIYSAALEKGITPATLINDAPLYYPPKGRNDKAWEPKNYDGTFEGPMSLRSALAKSKNIPSIRVLELTSPAFAQQWVSRFGFDAAKHPAYLTMALGAGAVTPLQMASAFGTFANLGRYAEPWLIERITDHNGKLLWQRPSISLEELPQVIDPRNAFVMNSMMQTVTRSGTAARAQSTLKRPDLYGKTGTTNDALDAWFAGFQPSLVAVTWVGYDNPRKLGARETGGGLSLPIWIDFMRYALKDVPKTNYAKPPRLVQIGDDFLYSERQGARVSSLGMEDGGMGMGSAALPPPTQEERSRILDLFRRN